MKKLLVVVDYQNDFVSGSLGFPRAAALEGGICRKIEEYRAQGAEVAFTFDTHGPDYPETREGKNLPVAHCLRDSGGWALYGRVARRREEGDRCFHKPAFGSLELAEYVRAGGYDEVELCGLVSNICVLSNAVLVKAALPEALVTVDAACTDCLDPEMNGKALDVLEGVQVRVVNRRK